VDAVLDTGRTDRALLSITDLVIEISPDLPVGVFGTTRPKRVRKTADTQIVEVQAGADSVDIATEARTLWSTPAPRYMIRAAPDPR